MFLENGSRDDHQIQIYFVKGGTKISAAILEIMGMRVSNPVARPKQGYLNGVQYKMVSSCSCRRVAMSQQEISRVGGEGQVVDDGQDIVRALSHRLQSQGWTQVCIVANHNKGKSPGKDLVLSHVSRVQKQALEAVLSSG